MSDSLQPSVKIAQALSEGRLFWLDSMANQNQLDWSCPYLRCAVCLYLFDLRSTVHLRALLDQPTQERLDTLLQLAPYRSETNASNTLDSIADPGVADDSQPTELGRSCLATCIDAFFAAQDRLTLEQLFTNQTDSALVRYFVMRMRLHWRQSPPADLPPAEKLKGLSDSFIFCALCFHLAKDNNQHAVAKVHTLHQAHRSSAHVNWLLHLIYKNDNQLDRAKGYFLAASYAPYFDYNLQEERGALFGGTYQRPEGLRGVSRPFMYGSTLVSEPRCESEWLPAFIQDECKAMANGSALTLALKRAVTEHRQFKPYNHLAAENMTYVSPEDFLRTFVFVFPPVDTFSLSLALSGIRQQHYVFQNIISLISASIGKLDADWPKTRDLKIVIENAAFIRRIWRSYENGVFNIPPMSQVIGLPKNFEHWDLVRQVWPKAKRVIIVPNAKTQSVIAQLNLTMDEDSSVHNLEQSSDWRLLAKRLGLSHHQVFKLRQRLPHWQNILMPEVAE